MAAGVHRYGTGWREDVAVEGDEPAEETPEAAPAEAPAEAGSDDDDAAGEVETD